MMRRLLLMLLVLMGTLVAQDQASHPVFPGSAAAKNAMLRSGEGWNRYWSQDMKRGYATAMADVFQSNLVDLSHDDRTKSPEGAAIVNRLYGCGSTRTVDQTIIEVDKYIISHPDARNQLIAVAFMAAQIAACPALK
jgi:hypothetical protein